MLNLETKMMFVSRDVKFVEDVYPFKMSMKNYGNILIDSSVGNVGDDVEMFQMMNPVDLDYSPDANSGNDGNVSPIVTNVDPNPNIVSDSIVTRPRRSNRAVKAPVWQKDYVMEGNNSVM